MIETATSKVNPPEVPERALDVFVHVPKTAGTSLRTMIIGSYGLMHTWVYAASSGLFFRADKQLFQPGEVDTRRIRMLRHRLFSPVTRPLIYCNNMRADGKSETHDKAHAVVGHFPHTIFDDMPNTRKIRKFTVLRDPLARMLSHYEYSQSLKNLGRHWVGWMQNDDKSLSFEDFAFSAYHQNFQTRLTGTHLRAYEAVGVTEHLPEFLCLSGLASYMAAVPYHNQTRRSNRDRVVADPGFLRAFRAFHALDYNMYEEALEVSKNFSLR